MGLPVITMAILDTFIRCLKSRFSEIELPPHEPQPSVVVGARPLVSEPPAVNVTSAACAFSQGGFDDQLQSARRKGWGWPELHLSC